MKEEEISNDWEKFRSENKTTLEKFIELNWKDKLGYFTTANLMAAGFGCLTTYALSKFSGNQMNYDAFLGGAIFGISLGYGSLILAEISDRMERNQKFYDHDDGPCGGGF